MYPAPGCGMLNPGQKQKQMIYYRRKNRPRHADGRIYRMKNKTAVSFYKPRIEDLWFREAMLADPDTMSYNAAWGGTIPFPREDWDDWYDYWVANPDRRFYRYITTGESRAFVGEAAYHYDAELQVYITDVIIPAKSRGRGYGKAGLKLLCEAAKKAGITELYDNIAIDNPGIRMFLSFGFQEEYRTDEIIMLRKSLAD